MNVILCVDDDYGLMFNNRRQSQDTKVREFIINLCKGYTLWMSPYSVNQFPKLNNINVAENCLAEANQGEYCFVEGTPLSVYEKWIEKVILIKWNRKYPSDVKLDISLTNNVWQCISAEEFVGNSHDKITVEVYER